LQGKEEKVTELEEKLHYAQLEFEALFELMNDGILLIDYEGNILKANQQAADIFGYKLKTMLKQNAYDLVAHKEVESAREKLRKVRKHKLVPKYTQEFKKKSGEKFLAELTLSHLTNRDGSTRYAQCIIKDLTAKQKVEEDLTETQAKYDAIINQDLIGVLLISDKGEIYFANQQVLNIFEYQRDSVEGTYLRDYIDLYKAEDINKLEEYFRKYRKEKIARTLQTEMEITTFQGNPKWISVNFTPTKLKGKNAVTSVMIDITDKKKAQKKLDRERRVYHLIADASVKAINLKELSQQILEGLIQLLGFESGSIRIYNEKEGSLIPIADYGLSHIGKELLKLKKIDDKNFFFKNHIGQKLFTVDITKHPILKKNKALVSDNYRSYISWPVYNANKNFLGSIQLGSRTMQPLHDDEEVFETISDMYATAIERLLASEESKLNQEQFKQTVESILDSIIIVEDSEVIYVNDRTCEIFGYERDELMKMHALDFIIPEQITDFKSQEEKLLKVRKDTEAHMEYWITRKDGTRRYLYIRTTIKMKNDTTRRDYIVSTDITKRKIAEEKLRLFSENLEQKVVERTNELQIAINELETFSYSVSHDLRAPLRSINGFSKILLQDFADDLNETGLDYLNRINSATLRMESLINNLLDLSRITRTNLQYKEINLSEFARAIVKEKEETFEDREIEFVIEDNLETIGDPKLMRIVIENLLSNALKFTKNKDEAVIQFSSKEEEGETIFFLKDNGIGFDMSFAGKLFKAFQRLHKPDDFEGTGIGLATVNRIIHRHHGRIWAESIEGKETTFYFTLNASLDTDE